ncbi:MAG: hypothetical protein HY269_05855 [Deltaproteobacteria bacterium]|nr:hypothetical protein [Deltaproteobacteria bacterium]
MDLDTRVKIAIYAHFAETGRAPTAADIAAKTHAALADVPAAFQRLMAQRVLFLENGGQTIRMAPPFSGVPTQHTVTIGPRRYFANCAWDTFGIIAALHQPGRVKSRCEHTLEPLDLQVDLDGPQQDAPGFSDWRFHCAVPAAHWWRDLVFT